MCYLCCVGYSKLSLFYEKALRRSNIKIIGVNVQTTTPQWPSEQKSRDNLNKGYPVSYATKITMELRLYQTPFKGELNTIRGYIGAKVHSFWYCIIWWQEVCKEVVLSKEQETSIRILNRVLLEELNNFVTCQHFTISILTK